MGFVTDPQIIKHDILWLEAFLKTLRKVEMPTGTTIFTKWHDIFDDTIVVACGYFPRNHKENSSIHIFVGDEPAISYYGKDDVKIYKHESRTQLAIPA